MVFHHPAMDVFFFSRGSPQVTQAVTLWDRARHPFRSSWSSWWMLRHSNWGDFRNPLKMAIEIVDLAINSMVDLSIAMLVYQRVLLLKAVLLKYDTYIYIYNVYTVLQNNVCLPWCFGLPFPLLNRSYQKILFAPASMDFRSMATIRMVGLKTMKYQTMPCSFW